MFLSFHDTPNSFLNTITIELLPAVESSIIITFESGQNSVTVTGISDMTEPYNWNLSNPADLIAFFNAVSHGDIMTVTIDDGLTPPLPNASAPTVTIGNVTSVDEGDDLEIVATVSGGTYDTLSLAGVMSSGGGSIGAFAYATGTDDWRATYTAPAVTGDINVQLTVTATATGTGTNAADGTTDDSTDTEGWTVNADTVPSRPAAPTVDQITHESARISWLAPGSGGSPITSYRMRYRVVGSGAGGWVTDDDATSPETITGLDASEDYQVQVRATNNSRQLSEQLEQSIYNTCCSSSST